MLRTVAATLLLLGCSRALPETTTTIGPQSAESLAIESVVAAWGARGDLPEVDVEEVRDVLITDARDGDTFTNACRACPPADVAPNCVSRWGRARGCTTGWNRCYGPVGMVCEEPTLIVVAPGLEPGTRLSIIRHEAIHILSALAGQGSDYQHRDTRLWPYACADDACRRASVEERAAGRGP